MTYSRISFRTLSLSCAFLLLVGQQEADAFGVPSRSLDSRLLSTTATTRAIATTVPKIQARRNYVHLNSMWSSDDEIEGIDKFKSCVPYMLPLLDGEIFGKYIYERIPPLGFLDSLFIGPLYESYSQVPFFSTIIFIGLTLGTRGNTDMSRNLRFNAQQACLIDIALIGPEIIGDGFNGEDIPRWLQEPCMNFVWYFYMSMVLWSIFKNLQGKKPNQIPWISEYAEFMVGPF
ncbi:MAG: hypothetical protein SGBAC_012650 [Bacillariaceae sp.]